MLPLATLYDWLLFLHIVAAMVWVGGLVAPNVLVLVVLRSGRSDEVARFVSALRVVGPATLAPAMLGVVGFGVWLVLDSDAWSFGQTWVWLALVLFGVAFVVGAGLQSRSALVRSTRSRRATAPRRCASCAAGRGACGRSSSSCS